jgi:hypothetical protein
VGNTMWATIAVGDLLKCGFTDRVTRRAALRALIDAGHISEIGRNSAGQQLYKVTVSPHPAAHSYRVPLPVSGKLDSAEASVAPSSTRTIVDVLREVALVDGRIPGTTLGAALKGHGLATTRERREATERLQQEGLLARVANDKHGLPVFQLALVPAQAPTSEFCQGSVQSLRMRVVNRTSTLNENPLGNSIKQQQCNIPEHSAALAVQRPSSTSMHSLITWSRPTTVRGSSVSIPDATGRT